jgi:uncharacterized protein YuzE
MATVTYEQDGDVLLIELLAGADGPQTEGEQVSPGVMLLYDGDGRVICIEITAASKTLAPGALAGLPAVAWS